MGYNNKSFLGALFVVLVATTPSAYGQPQPLITGQVRVTGQLVCSATGNPVPGTAIVGVANATVLVVCPRLPILLGPIIVASTVTGSNGSINVVVTTNVFTSVSFSLGICTIQVPLPVVNTTCTLLPTTGTLVARLISVPVGTPPISPREFAAGLFVRVP